MSSKTESGHPTNLANYEKLLANLTSLGASYNPSKANLKLEVLNTQLGSSKSAVAALNTAESAQKIAISERETAFEQLTNLITRSNNALKASDSSIKLDENAKTLIRKLQGRRASPKKTEEEKLSAITEGKPIVQKSTSQMSFDNRMANFDKYINFLTSITAYAPNEEELKIAALTSFQNNLVIKNNAAVLAATNVNSGRNLRNKIMYTANIGLVDTTVDVKNYIKSVFGATSSEYKAISGLKFVNQN